MPSSGGRTIPATRPSIAPTHIMRTADYWHLFISEGKRWADITVAMKCGVIPTNADISIAKGFNSEVFREFTNAIQKRGKTYLFIERHGLIAFWSYLMCMESAGHEKGNKTSALTDNYEHKLMWMRSLRNIAAERKRLNAADSNLEGKEQDIVNEIIRSARQVCPDLR